MATVPVVPRFCDSLVAADDDGTVAPTAVGGSVPFAPEYCIPTLRYNYDRFRTDLWGPYGFKDAFNLGQDWWATDILGIDQGPILIMIENYRNQRVWDVFMRDEQVQRGLARAGFESLSPLSPRSPPVSRAEQADSVLSHPDQSSAPSTVSRPSADPLEVPVANPERN